MEAAEEKTKNLLMNSTPTLENLLEARGASKLLRGLLEEIDVLGRVEAQTKAELVKEATTRAR